jgi:hypothetical protein
MMTDAPVAGFTGKMWRMCGSVHVHFDQAVLQMAEF